MRHIKYPSISQFRNVVSGINQSAKHYNTIPPKVTFSGSVKLHGTNGGIGWDGKNLWVQNRTQILHKHNTNYGFYNYVMENESYFKEKLSEIFDPTTEECVVVFGEWCGKNIAKGCALRQLEKMFVVFDFIIVDKQPNIDKAGVEKFEHYFGFTYDFNNPEINLYNVNTFKKFKKTIDFNSVISIAEASQEIAIEVDEVEKQCPVGKHFGVDGVGEGIVWRTYCGGKYYSFKTKGSKHSVSKVKTLVPIDVEKVRNVEEFCEYAVTPQRFEQALQEVKPQDIKDTGKVMKWIMQDINKEEGDVLKENKLTMKDISATASSKIREMYFKHLDDIAWGI